MPGNILRYSKPDLLSLRPAAYLHIGKHQRKPTVTFDSPRLEPASISTPLSSSISSHLSQSLQPTASKWPIIPPSAVESLLPPIPEIAREQLAMPSSAAFSLPEEYKSTFKISFDEEEEDLCEFGIDHDDEKNGGGCDGVSIDAHLFD